MEWNTYVYIKNHFPAKQHLMTQTYLHHTFLIHHRIVKFSNHLYSFDQFRAPGKVSHFQNDTETSKDRLDTDFVIFLSFG